MIDVEIINDIVEISLSGDLDVNQSKELEKIINLNIKDNRIKFIIILENVHYLSSSGIRVFIATMRLLKTPKGRLVLCNLSPSSKRTLNLVEMGSFFEIFRNVNDALKALSE